MSNFGTILKKLRQRKELTIEELASELNKKYGTKLSKSSVSRWENSGADPKLEFVRILVDYFEVDSKIFISDLGDEQSTLTQINEVSSKLEEERQQNVLYYANQQYEEQNKVVPMDKHKKKKERRIVEFPKVGATGAGIGEELYGDIIEETIQVYEDEIPQEADFCILVNGDSMEPTFKKGSYVFIEKQETAKDGQIVLVLFEGTALIKKVDESTFTTRLISLNPNYEDIIVEKHHQCKVLGKVVL